MPFWGSQTPLLLCGAQAAHKLPKDAGPRVVFADVEFKESQPIFHRLGVKSLPWLFRLPATLRVDPGANIRLKHEDVVRSTDAVLESSHKRPSMHALWRAATLRTNKLRLNQTSSACVRHWDVARCLLT